MSDTVEASVTEASLADVGLAAGGDSLLGYRVVLGTSSPPSIPAGEGFAATPEVMASVVKGCLASEWTRDAREIRELVVGRDFIALDLVEDRGMAFDRLRTRFENIPARYPDALESAGYRLGAFVPQWSWDTWHVTTFDPRSESAVASDGDEGGLEAELDAVADSGEELTQP